MKSPRIEPTLMKCVFKWLFRPERRKKSPFLICSRNCFISILNNLTNSSKCNLNQNYEVLFFSLFVSHYNLRNITHTHVAPRCNVLLNFPRFVYLNYSTNLISFRPHAMILWTFHNKSRILPIHLLLVHLSNPNSVLLSSIGIQFKWFYLD